MIPISRASLLGASSAVALVGMPLMTRLVDAATFADPADVAAMTAFLMGEGGRNITGAVMTVDAGATA